MRLQRRGERSHTTSAQLVTRGFVERVSISTPNPSAHVRDRGSEWGLYRDSEGGQSLEVEQNQWLAQKILQCGEIVGVSVDNCEGGCGSLVAFSHDREYQNREEMMKEMFRNSRIVEPCLLHQL